MFVRSRMGERIERDMETERINSFKHTSYDQKSNI
jgi:hypothetical protein